MKDHDGRLTFLYKEGNLEEILTSIINDESNVKELILTPGRLRGELDISIDCRTSIGIRVTIIIHIE